MTRGRFIVIEGLDGSGISTQARRLVVWLEARGVAYVLTREPTDGPIGAQIRMALAKRYEVDTKTLALMYATDRSDHVYAHILPSLTKGLTVVSERHVLSSLAYQGAQLHPAWVREINSAALLAVKPDLTVFLDVTPEAALSRIDAGRHSRELFENEAALAKTRDAFLRAIEVERGRGVRIEVLDGSAPIGDVAAQVNALVSEIL